MPFSILGLVLSGIPTAIVAYFQAGMMKGFLHDMQGGSYTFSPGMLGVGSLGALAALITTAILQGALIHATVQDLSGQPSSVGGSLTVGLRNFLSLIVVTILFAIAVVCGLVLLVVPGVMLACAWCVAAPSLVADRTGIFAAFSRSAELTRGSRWPIFGLVVIVVVVEWIISMIFNATGVGSIAWVAIPGGGGGGAQPARPGVGCPPDHRVINDMWRRDLRRAAPARAKTGLADGRLRSPLAL